MEATTHAKTDSRAARRARQEKQRSKKAIDKMSECATEVILIRHGETDWNAEHRIQGHLDPPLNLKGRQQAAQVAYRLAAEAKVQHIYSSDLQRCMQTAEFAAEALQLSVRHASPVLFCMPRSDIVHAYHGDVLRASTRERVLLVLPYASLTVSALADLRERHLGVLQGLTNIEAQKQEPEAWRLLVSGSSADRLPGGGESEDDVLQRATAATASIAASHPGQAVAVFVHGGVLAQLHRYASGHFFKGRNINCSLNQLMVDDVGKAWAVVKWGDIDHLSGIGYNSAAFGGNQKSG